MWRAESRCCSLWARLPDSGLGSVLGSEVLLSHGRVWQTPLGALQLVPPSQRVCRSLQCTLPPSSAHVSTSIHSNDARRILLNMLLILNSLEITFSFPFFCITFPIYARVSPESSSNQLQNKSSLRNPAVAPVGSRTCGRSAQLHSYNERSESTLRSRLSQTWLRFRESVCLRGSEVSYSTETGETQQ